MKNKGDVSVVIPFFRAGRFARQLARCLAEQTITPTEIIVIDDGRGVDFSRVFDEFQALSLCSITRFVSSWPGQAGPGGARNIGISIASGSFVAFLDSDDVWLPEYLEKMLALSVRGKYRAVVSEVIYNDEADYKTTRLQLRREVKRTDLLQTNLLHPPSVVLLREAFSQVEFPNTQHEDYALWLRLFDDNTVVGCWNEPLVVINRVAGSVSSNKWKAAIWHWGVLREYSGRDFFTRCRLFGIYCLNGIMKRMGGCYYPLLMREELCDPLPRVY